MENLKVDSQREEIRAQISLNTLRAIEEKETWNFCKILHLLTVMKSMRRTYDIYYFSEGIIVIMIIELVRVCYTFMYECILNKGNFCQLKFKVIYFKITGKKLHNWENAKVNNACDTFLDLICIYPFLSFQVRPSFLSSWTASYIT